MAKTFKQMNKEELVKATESLKLTDAVVAIAKDPENPTNAEYVTVLEEFKSKQDEVNSETKKDIEKEENKADTESPVAAGRVVNKDERAKLKDIKFKYVVTDHQGRNVIEDDDEKRTFPILYGNLTKGPKCWNVQLHGGPQALPFSVAKRLLEIPMIQQIKDSKGNPTTKTQKRFGVTKVDGWTQDEIEQLKRTQNTRKFKD